MKKNIIYELPSDIFSKINSFVRISVCSLNKDEGVRLSDIRISMPQIIINHLYRNVIENQPYREDTEFSYPNYFHQVKLIPANRNEISVFCIYFELNKTTLIKTLNLEQ